MCVNTNVEAVYLWEILLQSATLTFAQHDAASAEVLAAEV